MTTRRQFLRRAAASGAALAGFPAILRAAGAGEKITFATPFGFDPTFIDIMNASSGGHFADQGLDATVIGPPGTAESFQLVLSGQAQFALVAGTDLIRAVGAKAAPLTAIATIGQKSGFHLVSPKERPVRSGADLRGKTVGVLSIGGLTETFVHILMARAGVPEGATQIVAAGNSPGEVELIRQGRLDCFLCNFPVYFTLSRTSAPLEYLAIDTIAPAPGQVYYCTRETIATKPDLVVRVLRALHASVSELMTQPVAPIFRRAAKDFEIPRSTDIDALVALQQAVIAQSWLAQSRANLMRNVPALWQSGVAALREVHIAEIADATTLYTNDFIDQALKS
jgi:ABC-type nitrate/sulfonate/bicarbonate transport system substrate-binding protein